MCSPTEGLGRDSGRAGAGRFLRPPACAPASAQPVTALGTRLCHMGSPMAGCKKAGLLFPMARQS